MGWCLSREIELANLESSADTIDIQQKRIMTEDTIQFEVGDVLVVWESSVRLDEKCLENQV